MNSQKSLQKNPQYQAKQNEHGEKDKNENEQKADENSGAQN